MGGLFDALKLIGYFAVTEVSVLIYTLYSFEYIFVKNNPPKLSQTQNLNTEKDFHSHLFGEEDQEKHERFRRYVVKMV